jgi:hypothetical protein
MTRLIPLSQIPASARAAEAKARRAYATRALALEAAQVHIVSAPGCHSRPYFDPPTIGWVLTRAAGEALSRVQTHMPDHTSHCRMTVE